MGVMIGRLRDIFRGRNDGEWVVSFTTRADFRNEFDRLKDKDCEFSVKKFSPKRSLTANNFCWALCSDIGKALTPPLSKEEVYRQAIRAVGVWDTYLVKEAAVPALMQRWEKNGSGWFVEIVDGSFGMQKLHVYYGTSTYTAAEMERVISWLVNEAEQMELTIPLSKKEQKRMIEKWGEQ